MEFKSSQKLFDPFGRKITNPKSAAGDDTKNEDSSGDDLSLKNFIPTRKSNESLPFEYYHFTSKTLKPHPSSAPSTNSSDDELSMKNFIPTRKSDGSLPFEYYHFASKTLKPHPSSSPSTIPSVFSDDEESEHESNIGNYSDDDHDPSTNDNESNHDEDKENQNLSAASDISFGYSSTAVPMFTLTAIKNVRRFSGAVLCKTKLPLNQYDSAKIFEK